VLYYSNYASLFFNICTHPVMNKWLLMFKVLCVCLGTTGDVDGFRSKNRQKDLLGRCYLPVFYHPDTYRSRSEGGRQPEPGGGGNVWWDHPSPCWALWLTSWRGGDTRRGCGGTDVNFFRGDWIDEHRGSTGTSNVALLRHPRGRSRGERRSWYKAGCQGPWCWRLSGSGQYERVLLWREWESGDWILKEKDRGWKSKAMMRCIPLCPVLPTRHVRSFTMLQMAGALKVTPQIGSGIIHPFSCWIHATSNI